MNLVQKALKRSVGVTELYWPADAVKQRSQIQEVV